MQIETLSDKRSMVSGSNSDLFFISNAVMRHVFITAATCLRSVGSVIADTINELFVLVVWQGVINILYIEKQIQSIMLIVKMFL